jgi:hypothetical protein
MKKWFLLSVMLGAVSLSGLAQDDDMYFVPTKKNVARERASYGIPTNTYYSGSSRSVDEYNRRWGSSYEVLPADTGDIISFAAVEGIYPDSVGEFSLTKQMARFDGYEPSAAYWAGYNRGYSDSWGWHSPWYYSYYPWYDSWYWDPWYWDSWYYSPYYYSGWYYPYHYSPWYYGGWYGGGGITYVNRYPGTQNHGRISGSGNRGFATGRTHTYASGTFGSSRSMGTVGTSRGSFNNSRTGTSTITRTRTAATPTYSNSYGNFGGSYSNSSSSGASTSRSSGSSYSGGGSSGGGGGSFGGSRSGGGGGGGGRSGGGGFGSGRR